MLIIVNTEKLKKSMPDLDLENLLSTMNQNIDCIDIINKEAGIKDNIKELAAFIDCLEIRKDSIAQTVDNIMELTKVKEV